VTKLSPASARSRGGARIVITGTGFSGATRVSFGAFAASSFQVTSPTRIVAVVPPGRSDVHVTVTADGRTSSRTRADLFVYLSPPVVTAVTPASGPSVGGTVVAIHGHDLTGTRTVRFGAALARDVVARSSSELLVTSPKGSGTVSVRVTTGGGTSAPVASARFSYSRS
jgi:hypothetical protein